MAKRRIDSVPTGSEVEDRGTYYAVRAAVGNGKIGCLQLMPPPKGTSWYTSVPADLYVTVIREGYPDDTGA